MVEYGTVDDELLACVVTPQRVDLVRRMASWTEVETGVRGLRFQIETLRHGAKPLRRHVAQLAARATARLSTLHQQLWAPLAPVWEATAGPQRVLVVPHGLLGAQPFAALDDAAVALGQRCQLALAPSARAVLRGLLWPSVAAQRILALGESSRLPQASAEAQAVELAKTLALKAATVVLSACETGLTDSQAASGDEMVGLVRAFWVAGAARVLASQWPVDDAGTAAVMAGFYRALVGGAGPVAVLQVAQTQTRQRHPHPYFWAAFSRFGGW